MNIKKFAVTFAISSLVLGTSLSSISSIQAETQQPRTILDQVYDNIIPDEDLIVYTFDNPFMYILGTEVVKAFNDVGITVTNTLPEIVGTGTKVETDSHTYTILIYGDVNGDGEVDVLDVQRILVHETYPSTRSLTGVYLEAGNVKNDDDETDIMDALRLERYTVGLAKKILTIDLPESKDLVAPVITLVGDSDITIQTGTNYVDKGATVKDNRDADKTIQGVIYKDNVEVNSIDTSVAGDYQIKYNTTDNAGNAATEVIRNIHVRKLVSTLNYTNPDMASKEIYSNLQGTLLKTIKVDGEELPYDVSELKAYVTKNGEVIPSDKLNIYFVQRGNNYDIYCDTKNELGNISIVPYLGTSYDTFTAQGATIVIRVMNKVTSLNINDTDKSKLKELVFFNGIKSVDVMSDDILLNPTDTSKLKEGQIVIKTTGNVTIEKKTLDDNGNIVGATLPQSVIKYIEINSTDANVAEGTVEIYAVGHEADKQVINVEKASLKGIKLPYNSVNMSLSDPEDVTAEKIQNREIVKKLVGSKVYLLIPIEFYQDASLNTKYDGMTVGDVYIKTGGFAQDLVNNKLTFMSNNPSLKLSTKLFAVVNNELQDVTSNKTAPFDYVGFLFQTDVTDLEITVSFGNVTNVGQPGYVAPKILNINKQ